VKSENCHLSAGRLLGKRLLTAPPKGTTSHVAKTVAKTKSELALVKRLRAHPPSRNGVTPIQSRFKSGDWVSIDCPRSADLDQRRHNGCWGRVVDVTISGNLKVEVGSNGTFMASDLQALVNPSPALCRLPKSVGLLKQPNLDAPMLIYPPPPLPL